MSNFNLAAFLAHRKEFNFVEVSIEGVDFNLIELNDELIEKVKIQETYRAMVLAAADFGVSVGRDRACDDAILAEELGFAWLKDELTIDCESSLKEQAGLEVCELSGLSSFVNDKKEYEVLEAEEANEEQMIKVGES